MATKNHHYHSNPHHHHHHHHISHKSTTTRKKKSHSHTYTHGQNPSLREPPTSLSPSTFSTGQNSYPPAKPTPIVDPPQSPPTHKNHNHWTKEWWNPATHTTKDETHPLIHETHTTKMKPNHRKWNRHHGRWNLATNPWVPRHISTMEAWFKGR